MHTAIPLTVLATALACSLATTPANARARVFVASYGNDSNPCTFGSPCRNFQQAVTVVDVTVKNLTFGVMPTDIYLAGFVLAFLSQVTQAPNPGVVGIQCADLGAAAHNAVALYLDNTTNHLWGISSGCGSTLGVWD